MRITTQEEHERLLRSRSLILNRPANDIHRPPRFFQMLDFSKQGLEHMLEERTGENGSLPFYRQRVREALRAWDTYNRRQAIKAPKPLGVWAETINKSRAWVRTIEAESREIHRLLKEQTEKEEREVKRAVKPRGHLKMKNGALASVDGRAVVAGGDDVEPVFADTGERVHEYLEGLRQSKRAKSIAKAKRQADLAERLKAARASSVLPQG